MNSLFDPEPRVYLFSELDRERRHLTRLRKDLADEHLDRLIDLIEEQHEGYSEC